MKSELVVNARRLTGSGPLWMLCETGLDGPSGRVRLIISAEQTAREVIDALQACGLPASLDPIGDEYHVICHPPEDGAVRIREWLQSRRDEGA